MLMTSEDCVGRHQYKKWQKPYWDPSLTEMSKSKKQAHAVWVSMGRPRNDNCVEWLRYKSAKCALRRGIRRAHYAQQEKLISKINTADQKDAKTFWRLINSSRGKTNNRCQPMQSTSGDIHSDPNIIRNDWKEHFQKLATPQSGSADPHDEQVESLIIEMGKATHRNRNMFLDSSIDIDEVKLAQRSIKLGKACGWDSISPEHIKYGGLSLVNMLVIIFNSIVIHEHVPANFKYGIVVPLFKGGNKDPSIRDNYRGITLKTSLSKLYEKILLGRLQDTIAHNSVISPFQGACRSGGSSLDVSFLVQECSHLFRENSTPIKVILLDLEKAFDSVWLTGLMYKLYINGINAKAWRLIKEYYGNYQCAVLYENSISDYYKVQQGVHQGGVLSMNLFTLYIGSILNNLATSGHGCRTGGLKLSCTAYADDITILAPFAKSAQSMVNSVVVECDKWHLRLNPAKCVYIDIDDKDLGPITIKNVAIKRLTISNHVGVPVCSSLTLENGDYLDNRISSARRSLNSFLGTASEIGGINPLTLSQLYWSCVIPKLLYGLEMLDINDKAMAKINSFHVKSAKRIQRLPVYTASVATTAQLGWLSIQATLDKSLLLFIRHILCLSQVLLARKLFLDRFKYLLDSRDYLKSRSPVARMVAVAIKYNVLEIVVGWVENGVNFSKYKWRKHVHNVIYYRDTQLWKCNVVLFPSTSIYATVITSIKPCVWWKLSKMKPLLTRKCVIMLKLLCNVYCFASKSSKFKNYEIQPICLQCGCLNENLTHFIAVCPYFETIRSALFNNINIICGMNLKCFSPSFVVHFILSCGYTEHKCLSDEKMFELAECIALKVYQMHVERFKLYTQIA